jgi:trimeric autotransporter adhesin
VTPTHSRYDAFAANHRMHTAIARLPQAVFAVLVATPLAAQCELQWAPGAGTNGPDGRVFAVLALPNGDIVAGGDFRHADHAFANDVARWNGTTWQALGTGTGTAVATVQSLARMPNGDLVAGGFFLTMGGQACNRVARWNGTSWSPMGTGLGAGSVDELLVLPNGDLIAAGSFALAGSVAVDRLARWNGSAWSAVGTGLPPGGVATIGAMPNGDLVVGGTLGTGPLRLVGGTWQTVPGLDPAYSVSIDALTVLPNGSVAVMGSFRIGGVMHGLAILDGITAQPLTGGPFSGAPGSLLAAANGDLVSASNNSVRRWNGASWSTSVAPVAPITAMAEDGAGRIVVGAEYTSPEFAPRPNVARFHGSSWQTLGAGTPPMVLASATLKNGDIVVGGEFTSIGGVTAARVARRTGAAWSPLGSGVDDTIVAIAPTANGDVLVGGEFSTAGGAPAQRIARWNGATWSPVGNGLPFTPYRIVELTNGEILASGPGQFRRWNGTAWLTAGFATTTTHVRGMAALPDGTAILVGTFATATTAMLYANGTATPIPGAPNLVLHWVTRLDDGSFVAGGVGMQRWNGSVWTPLPGSFFSRALAALPNGDFVACGHLQSFGTSTPSAMYRLANDTWQPFGDVLGGDAHCVTATPSGEILVGGVFTTVNGAVSKGCARASAPCPGATAGFGVGCNALAGPIALSPIGLPFVGGVYRARTSGLFTNSVALALAGLPSPAFPVPGSPGCFGYVNPLATELVFPVVGTATLALSIPNDPALVGLQLRLQMAAIEFGGATVSIATTNALDLTVGTMGL